MIQQIITFLIVVAALVYAFSGFIKKPKRKQKSTTKTNLKNESLTMQHNCSGCSAECMLRNSAKPLNEEKTELCKQIEIEQKL